MLEILSWYFFFLFSIILARAYFGLGAYVQLGAVSSSFDDIFTIPVVKLTQPMIVLFVRPLSVELPVAVTVYTGAENAAV